MMTHGDAGWAVFPSYLDTMVPRVLSFLKARNLTITFFIVGQDAALDKNREALTMIPAAGHEIGNHSFHHEPWLHLYSEQQVKSELARAEEHIEDVTGQKPVGFRGPGFSLSCAVLRELSRRGYEYDATTLPTFLGPVARAIYLMTAKLSPEEIQKRKAILGSLRDGFRPIGPYRWHLDDRELIEIPVTTMPLLKTPMHVSYVLYLATFAPALALYYFRLALKLCLLTGTQPSLLLHPLDFLGCEDKELSFFPGMNLPRERKMEIISEVCRLLADEFTPVTLRRHARDAAQVSGLQVVEPRFRHPS
jgi:hypothetical protein